MSLRHKQLLDIDFQNLDSKIKEVKQEQDLDNLLDTYTSNGLKIMLLTSITPKAVSVDTTLRSPRSSLKRTKITKKFTLNNIQPNSLKKQGTKFNSAHNVFRNLKILDQVSKRGKTREDTRRQQDFVSETTLLQSRLRTQEKQRVNFQQIKDIMQALPISQNDMIRDYCNRDDIFTPPNVVPESMRAITQARIAASSGLARNKKLLGPISPFMKDNKLYETENQFYHRHKAIESAFDRARSLSVQGRQTRLKPLDLSQPLYTPQQRKNETAFQIREEPEADEQSPIQRHRISPNPVFMLNIKN